MEEQLKQNNDMKKKKKARQSTTHKHDTNEKNTTWLKRCASNVHAT
jgi:hypothetical protein